MGYFEQFPYTNFHELNLDWLLDQMKKLGSAFDAFVETNILKYSDPIDWSIATQYETNTIVRNGEDVYLSKQAVPAGVAITDTDYWFKVGDLSTYQLQLDLIRHQIAADDEGTNVNASQSYASGAVFWLNSYLSRASQAIAAGTPFVLGENYTRVTVLELFNDLVSRVDSSISSMQSDITDIAAVNRPGRKRVICIGDSIAQGYTPNGTVVGWPELMRQKLGLTSGSTFYFGGRGSAGMVAAGQGANFIQLLESVNASDPETITDIYCIGGVNDVTEDVSYQTCVSAVATFCDTAKTLYPNAAVHIGCIAYYANPNNRAAGLKNIHAAYKDGCRKNARMIPGILSAMCKMSDFDADGIHVKAGCQGRIANNAINECGSLMWVVGAGEVNTAKVNVMPAINYSVYDNSIHYFLFTGYCTMADNTALNGSGTTVDMGSVSESAVMGISYGSSDSDIQIIPFHGSAQRVADNAYVPCFGFFAIYNRRIYARVWATYGAGWSGNIKSFNWYQASGSVPIV